MVSSEKTGLFCIKKSAIVMSKIGLFVSMRRGGEFFVAFSVDEQADIVV